MRAYVGCVDHSGLQRFLPEDRFPRNLLRELVHAWSRPTTTVVWAVVAASDAEAVNRSLQADCPGAARDLLLNRAIELFTLGSVVSGRHPDGLESTDAEPRRRAG